jgi:hypothetical protein
VVDAGSRVVIGEDPPANGIVRRGVVYRWRGGPPYRRREPSPEVLEVIRRGERKLYEEYLAARAKRRAT